MTRPPLIPPGKLQWKTLLFPMGLLLPPKIDFQWKLWLTSSLAERKLVLTHGFWSRLKLASDFLLEECQCSIYLNVLMC